MSLDAYADFVYRAGWLHLDDPAAAWRDYAGKLRAAGRPARPRCARCAWSPRTPTSRSASAAAPGSRREGSATSPTARSSPGPVEAETSGDVRFSFPAVMGGREVQDVRLRFENGRVVRAEAAVGGAYLDQMLAMDDGASMLGEFAIGTNYMVTQFTKQILFDEKIGGTCHMALGVGYPDTGSVNRSACTGTWCATCAPAARSTPTAS